MVNQLGKPPDHHSLDYGFEILTNQNRYYYFIWGSEFTQYDVKFTEGRIANEFKDQKNIKEHLNITHSNWQPIKDKKITDVKVIWSHWSTSNQPNKNQYPQTIKLTFENQKNIWISVLEIWDNQIMGMKDHITILFDSKAVQKYDLEN